MEHVAIAIIFLVLTGFQKQPIDIKLQGKYRMEYETEFASENCIINIKGNSYDKKLNSGIKRKGEIFETKTKFANLFTLKDRNSDLQVDIVGKTYKISDTIFFRTKKSLADDDKSALTIYSGKLIKIN